MHPLPEQQLNQDAFHRIKDKISQTYPYGRFVAISGGRIVADAEQFEELRAQLIALGKDPSQVLVVQAGVDYPESALIFIS